MQKLDQKCIYLNHKKVKISYFCKINNIRFHQNFAVNPTRGGFPRGYPECDRGGIGGGQYFPFLK